MLTFSIRTRVDCVDREMLIRLKKAGCKQINYGVESYQTEVLKILGKRVSGDLNKTVIKMTREIDISTLAYIILGSPGETISQIRNTVNETVESDPDYAYIQALTPAPATAIYNLGLKKGLYEDYWRRLVLDPVSNCKMPVWAEFDTEVLNNEITRAALMFYIRPKFIIRKLRELTSWKELIELAKIFFNMLLGRNEYIGGS